MTDHLWSETRATAVTAFRGETPGATLEQTIIDEWEKDPKHVEDQINAIAIRLEHGAKISSPWAILRKAVTESAQTHADIKVTDTQSRNKRIANADRWLANAGLHYDRWEEVQDDLFGSRGILHAWADSAKLQQRMQDAWTTIRPTGEQIDAAELERAEHWRTHRPDKPKPRVIAAPPLPDEPEPADYDYGNPQEPEPT